MASITDVMSALQTQVADALIAANITLNGTVIKGWPNMPALTKQMEIVPAQYCVSVYPLPAEKKTTRLFPLWQVQTEPNVTLGSSLSGGVLTFSGTVATGFNVMVVLNAGISGATALYQTSGTDTLASIATGVAAKINAITGFSAVASGDTVTISGAKSIICNIGGSGVLAREVRRTERQFQLSTWCPDGPTRAAIADAIDLFLATVYFLSFPDGSSGRLTYVRGPWNDEMQRDTLYFAHQIFAVEWGTMQTTVATQVAAVETTMQQTQANGQVAQTTTDTEG